LLTALAATVALAASAAAPAPPAWRAVETTHLGAYTLVVQSNDGADDSPRLVVAAPGGKTTVVSLNGGLALVKNAITTASLAAQNRLHSSYLYAALALNDGAAGDQLVAVFGAAEDPDPFAFRVLRLAPDGQVATLLSEDAFELTAIAHLDKGAAPELIGRPSWSQMDTKCLSTYDPLAVYRLSDGRYAYDAALSQAYDVAHYVWAGPKSREDVAVDICHKPLKLVPAPKS